MAFQPSNALPPCVLFEDEHLLVVNKPAGWNTHAPGPYAGEGIYDWLRHREPRWAKLAIIHRLDKETSGVMVFGKTPVANRSLTEQFTQRLIRKQYLLLTDRAVERKEFTVVSSLVRVGDKYLSRPMHAGAERAETRFKISEAGEARRLIPKANGGSQETQANPEPPDVGCYTVLEAEPVTGRTHQIRVHAAASGFPIVGDTLYGGTPARRVCLHATELRLRHPASGEELAFNAPADFSADARLLIRQALIEPEFTDAFRLLHGGADGCPGWYVDRLGDFLLSQAEQPFNNDQQKQLIELLEKSSLRGVYHKFLSHRIRNASVAENSPRHVFGEAAPEKFLVRENGLQFELSFNEGYSVGLFLDQRDNRRRLLTGYLAAAFPLFMSESRTPKPEILNAFAYTCGFSVCAAKAGARTTSLDLSKKYLEWGKRNFVLNGLNPADHDFIYGDVFDWLRRLQKKRRSFEVVALDPPTFSRSKEHGAFRAENDYGQLVELALPLLRPNGVMFASTNAAELKPETFLETVTAAIRSSGRKISQQHYVPQPPDFPVTHAEPAYLKTAWLRIA